jgi:hypothetical protein
MVNLGRIITVTPVDEHHIMIIYCVCILLTSLAFKERSGKCQEKNIDGMRMKPILNTFDIITPRSIDKIIIHMKTAERESGGYMPFCCSL